jgi:hypothetical protein
MLRALFLFKPSPSCYDSALCSCNAMVSGATIRSHSPNVFTEALRHDLQVYVEHRDHSAHLGHLGESS